MIDNRFPLKWWSSGERVKPRPENSRTETFTLCHHVVSNQEEEQ